MQLEVVVVQSNYLPYRAPLVSITSTLGTCVVILNLKVNLNSRMKWNTRLRPGIDDTLEVLQESLLQESLSPDILQYSITGEDMENIALSAGSMFIYQNSVENIRILLGLLNTPSTFSSLA